MVVTPHGMNLNFVIVPSTTNYFTMTSEVKKDLN